MWALQIHRPVQRAKGFCVSIKIDKTDVSKKVRRGEHGQFCSSRTFLLTNTDHCGQTGQLPECLSNYRDNLGVVRMKAEEGREASSSQNLWTERERWRSKSLKPTILARGQSDVKSTLKGRDQEVEERQSQNPLTFVWMSFTEVLKDERHPLQLVAPFAQRL